MAITVWITMLVPWAFALPWVFETVGHGPELVEIETGYGQILLLGGVLRYAPEGAEYAFGDNANVANFLFLVPIVTFFLGMTGSCTEFIIERRLLKHERLIGVPPRYYLVSKLVVLAVWGALATAAFVLVSAWTLGIPGPVGWLYLLAFGTSSVGLCCGLLVSAFADNVRVAFGFVPLVLIPQVLFSGSFGIPKADELVKRRVGYAMTLNWSLDQAKRIAMCTPEQEKPPEQPGAGCSTCLHTHDPFSPRPGCASDVEPRHQDRTRCRPASDRDPPQSRRLHRRDRQ